MGSLSALLAAVKVSHGDQGVTFVLEKINKSIHSGTSATSSLAVAEAALAEMIAAAQSTSILCNETSPAGVGILEAAYRDGSSVICKHCGGLIARERWTNHVEFWCGKEDDVSENENEDSFEDARMDEDD